MIVPKEFCAIPRGKFRAKKLGAAEVEYICDQESIDRVIEDRNKRGQPLCFDYNHQMLYGGDASAAGWSGIQARSDGIWCVNCDWTPKAQAHFANKEYRYFSPVFVSDAENRVTELFNIALTNTPAMLQQKPLIELSSVPQTGLAILGAIDMEMTALLAALSAKEPEQIVDLVKALRAGDVAAQAKIATLSAENKALQAQVAEVMARSEQAEKQALIIANSTKIVPALAEFWAKQPLETLKAYLSAAPDVVAPRSDAVKQPNKDGNADIAACSALKGRPTKSLTEAEWTLLHRVDPAEYERRANERHE